MSDEKKESDCLKLHQTELLGTLNTHNRETRTFSQLGPYEARRTVFSSDSFHILDPRLKSPNPLFLIHREAFQGEKKGLAKLIVNFPLEGQMSPKHAVTLGAEARKQANIPDTAKYYVWSYPIDVQWRHYEDRLMSHLRDCHCLGSPELMFLIMGGYVYFDEDYKVVSTNALMGGHTKKKEEELARSGRGIKFGKPVPFPAKYINQLTFFDRFKVVSWPGLAFVDNPPTFFAWLRPHEELVAPDRERRKFGPHGGFVFVFHKDLDEKSEELTALNCYFPVICSNEDCCSDYSEYIRANQNPLSVNDDNLSLDLSRKKSAKDELKERVEAAWDEKKERGLSGTGLQDIQMPTLCEDVDDEVDEDSSDERDQNDIMKSAFLRKSSRYPSCINAQDDFFKQRSLYHTKSIATGTGLSEIHEMDGDELNLDEVEFVQPPKMNWGATTILVREFEGFAERVKQLDGRVLGYFLASLPDNVLAKINLDQVINSGTDDVSAMRLALGEVLKRNADHGKRVAEIRRIVELDLDENQEEFDKNITLEKLERQFENHLAAGIDSEEGLENRLLFSELIRRFYYYVKPIAQAKAELEARIKEKYWLKLRYRDTLRIIRNEFRSIGDYTAFFSDYCYLAKIVMNFLDPPRKIPFYEDGENSEFKRDEHVIIRPLNNEKPRIAIIGRRLPNKDYQLKNEVGLTLGKNEIVKPHRIQRLFKWSCFRCENTDREMWRDTYPLRNWVCCMKCGLVTQKTLSTTRYQLRKLIRDSCYGGIYFGYDAEKNRDCAIKKNDKAQVRAKTRKGTDTHVAEDIEKEIKFHNMLCPQDSPVVPGILGIYDQYEDESNHFLVLEWADKGEVFEHVVTTFSDPQFMKNIKAIKLWKVKMKQMFYEICLGVKKIHDHGIVHRDLSLENLLLIENKNYVHGKMPKLRPVICDFGLATEDLKTFFKDSVGKLGYMSPECWGGNYKGKPNDIWCMGIILVMMTIGAPPYSRIGDKAYRYLTSGVRPMKYLFAQYRRDHLVPEEAYEVFVGIFRKEKDRLTIDDILKTKYCRTAQHPDYHKNLSINTT